MPPPPLHWLSDAPPPPAASCGPQLQGYIGGAGYTGGYIGGGGPGTKGPIYTVYSATPPIPQCGN